MNIHSTKTLFAAALFAAMTLFAVVESAEARGGRGFSAPAMSNMGGRTVLKSSQSHTTSNVYKTRNDTSKNAINHVR
jgi:hypothetical protein